MKRQSQSHHYLNLNSLPAKFKMGNGLLSLNHRSAAVLLAAPPQYNLRIYFPLKTTNKQNVDFLHPLNDINTLTLSLDA